MSEHTQVGPYALGLLEPLEMSRFEEHLAECDECGAQLEWMLPVADQLADVEPGDLFGIEGPSAFSAPGGSVQQSMTMTDQTRSMPSAQAPDYPEAYPPPRELHAPRYPDELPPVTSRLGETPRPEPLTGGMPTIDPRTGSMPTIDPRTGSMPTVDPRTGGMPTIDPRTGSMPTIDPRTGSMPTVDPRTGSMPTADPRTSSIPRAEAPSGSIPRIDPQPDNVSRMDPRTGDIPRAEPPTGENRIVPLVRGGDARRRTQAQPPARRPEADYPPSRREAEYPTDQRRHRLLIAAAAALLGAAAGAGAMITGPWAEDSSPSNVAQGQPPVELVGEKLSATDAQTGVHTDVGLDSKPWGTLVSFTVSDIDGPRDCRLVAVLQNGKTEVLSTWVVPEQGYNKGTVPPELTLEAATALNRRDIAALRVQDVNETGDAATLVTVRA